MSLPNVIREYGEAFRGDWASIDGRGVRSDMDVVADWIASPDTYPGDEGARSRLGICLAGWGHWQDHCAEPNPT